VFRKQLKIYFRQILFFLSLAISVSAFQASSLHIVVTDQNSAIIANPTIRLKNHTGLVQEIIKAESQTIGFSKLDAGKYILEITADGFKPHSQNIEVKSGRNEFIIKLEIGGIVENVIVKRDEQEKQTDPRDGAFSGFLTRDQIENLPDDPDELKRELQQLAGGEATFRVDGFTGGRLPAKSQIASIKIIRSTFDSEFHEIGLSVVDIITKAGGSNWDGSVGFRFNDESLNARHPFASSRVPTQFRVFDFFINGPIIKDKTSISIFAFGDRSYDSENIVAALPDRQIQQSIKRTSDSLYTSAKITHNLSKTHSLNLSYDFISAKSGNFGVGGFDLPQRAYETKSRTNQLRVSESGYIGTKYLHEFRLQFKDEILKTIPLTNLPTIIVLNSFNDGGAGQASNIRQQNFSLGENLLSGFGRHALKIGALLEYERQKVESADNQNGIFLFSSLNDFQLGKASTFSQRPGNRKVTLSQVQIGSFIQDDIRIHKSFSLSLGLRYEWQNNLSDKNNFSPRLGFLWSPGKSGLTTFRGGLGLFYNWLPAGNLATILSQDINQPGETIIVNPGFPDPLASGTKVSLPSGFSRLADDLKNPYILLSSFGVERRILPQTSLRILYKFQRGVHQFRSRDINSPLADSFRPDSRFGRIIQVESSAFFVQHSLETDFHTNFSKTLFLLANYTVSKRTSDADGIFFLPTDNNDLSLDRSVSNYDRRHRFYTSVNWKFRKGFNFSTNYFTNSPAPYTITTGRDENGDTNFNDRPIGIRRNSERGSWHNQVDTSLSWTFSFGEKSKEDKGPTSIVLVGGEVPDFDLSKNYSLKFYISARNILNQTNLTNFVGVQTSSFFGQATSAQIARKIEFGIRFNF
jgi:hypothetical protein